MRENYAVPSGDFGAELVKALGLEGRSISSITFRAKAGELAQVRITEELYEGAGRNLVKVTQRYQLVPKKEVQ